MAASALSFVGLSDDDREETRRLGELAEGDRIEMRVRRRIGDDLTVTLPPGATALVQSLLNQLANGDRVAVLAENQELSPNDAARVLGISRPLVVHRMDIGDLAFRYVGKHRRTTLRDVLALKARIDAQRSAMEALAEDAADLEHRYGV